MRASRSFPATCSGDIYAIVPTAEPGLVRCSLVRHRRHGRISGTRLVTSLFCQAEVENLRLPEIGYEKIRRLDVAMHHPLGVGSFEGGKNLYRKLQNTFGIERLARDPLAQRFSFQQLHGDERLAVGFIHLVDRANVGMIQCGSRASLAPKSLERLRLLFQFLRKKFQRHAAAELCVLGLVNDTHPTAAQLVKDAVMRNGFSGHLIRLGRRS